MSIDNAAKIANYSYSFPFIYKTEFKNDETKMYNGHRICELNVPSKYLTQDELLTNEVHKLTTYQWHSIHKNIEYFIQTANAKGLIARTEEYLTQLHHLPSHQFILDIKTVTKLQ